jgi:hypothetical protein
VNLVMLSTSFTGHSSDCACAFACAYVCALFGNAGDWSGLAGHFDGVDHVQLR